MNAMFYAEEVDQRALKHLREKTEAQLGTATQKYHSIRLELEKFNKELAEARGALVAVFRLVYPGLRI